MTLIPSVLAQQHVEDQLTKDDAKSCMALWQEGKRLWLLITVLRLPWAHSLNHAPKEHSIYIIHVYIYYNFAI